MDKVEHSWKLHAPRGNRNIAVLIEVESPRTTAVRAKALPERMEAPVGLACRLSFVPIRRVVRGVRFRQSVDRNSFRSPRGERDVRCGRPRSVQPCPIGSTSMGTAVIRYAPRAVGLKPSAMRDEARLRGPYRIISSKTITPPLKGRFLGRDQWFSAFRRAFAPHPPCSQV